MEAFLVPVILFLIFIGTAYYVLVPFLSEKVLSGDGDEAARTTALELRKVNLYGQIREAEFERQMGLVDDEDFNRTKADLVAEVAEVMRGLEETPGDHTPPESVDSASGCPRCGAPVELGTRFCTQCGTAMAPPSGPRQRRGAACPGCGAAVSSGDRFCAGCGRGLLN